MKTTRASYYENSFIQSEGNARKTWRNINNLVSRRQNNQIVKEMKVNDISIRDSSQISNAFNEQFSTTGPRLAREIPLTWDEGSIYLNNIPENCNKFSFRPTLWNSLPCNIRESRSLNQFKRLLYHHF